MLGTHKQKGRRLTDRPLMFSYSFPYVLPSTALFFRQPSSLRETTLKTSGSKMWIWVVEEVQAIARTLKTSMGRAFALSRTKLGESEEVSEDGEWGKFRRSNGRRRRVTTRGGLETPGPTPTYIRLIVPLTKSSEPKHRKESGRHNLESTTMTTQEE
jgi:hypothetical protein